MSSKQRWFCPKISHSFQTDRWSRHSSLRCGFQTAFSPFVLFVSQPKRLSAESQHQQPRPRVVRGQKSRLLLLPRPSIICKLAWGAISQTNAPKQRKKKILPSRHPSVVCENVHLWGSGANAGMASIQRQASNLQSLSSSENCLDQQKTPVWMYCVGSHIWIVIKTV